MVNDQKLLAEAYGGMVDKPIIKESHPSAARFASLRHKLEQLKWSRSEIVIDNTLDQIEYLLNRALDKLGSSDVPKYGVTTESVIESWKRAAASGGDVYDFLEYVKTTFGQEVLENDLVINEALKKLQFEK